MKKFALFAAVLIVAAFGWRTSLSMTDHDVGVADWCPVPEICIPAADIKRFSIPTYATSQRALPTEFLMRAGADLGVREEAVAIAIYPKPSAAIDDFELVSAVEDDLYAKVLYNEKFGNQHTWRVMARSHSQRGGSFYRTENLVYYCNEHDICNALIHRGKFEASIFLDRESLNKIPALRQFFLSMFQSWNQSD
jgi:hypothetical protein